MAVRAAVSLDSPHAGPVTVWARREERSFGVWTVRAGEPGAFIGVEEPGSVTIRWRLPGRKALEKEVIVENRPVRMLLDGR